MRRPSWFLPLIVAALGMSIAGCGDVVTRHYDTLAEYKIEDHGWLPAALFPASTYDITTINNLDLSTSSGQFSFDHVEAAAFLAQLKPGAPTRLLPDQNWNRIVQRHAQAGRTTWTHSGDGSIWVFFCDRDKGYCEYDMWDAVKHTTLPPDASS